MKPKFDDERSETSATRCGEIRSGRAWGWVRWGVLMALGIAWTRAAERQEPAVPGMPIGSIVAFAGGTGTVPEAQGWMLCDGRELAVSQYPALHAAIGAGWGASGNGSMFRLPDFRGRFLRGVNLTATGPGRDPDAAAREPSAPGGNAGNEVGTVQEDAVGRHHHALAGLGDATGPGLNGEWLRFFGYKVPDDSAPILTNTAAVHPGDGLETRPSNAAVHWIIRVR
ncbi:MAG: tail fiber protein [Verrucomicrobiales bacterium]|nr:tail fiber protein [Verrucomicrobiales bacterium]